MLRGMGNGCPTDSINLIMTDKTLNGLYAITDTSLLANNFAEAIEQTLLGGARIIQYRDKSTDTDRRLKEAQIIRKLCDKYDATFIINDDLKLAIDSQADGVHLGKDDHDIKQARQRLGNEKIIGTSCYNQLQLALEAEQAGADYVAFGAFFNSSIKPEALTAPISIIAEAKAQIQLPVCCIGGITAENAGQLIDAGTDMIAVISDVFNPKNEKQSIKQASLTLSQLFSA